MSYLQIESALQETEPAVHGWYSADMWARVSQLDTNIRVPAYRRTFRNLWHIVMVARYISFCQDVWAMNFRAQRILHRHEIEACWFRFVMNAYQLWDPRPTTKTKTFYAAFRVKQKVLQKAMLQIYDQASDAFWAEKLSQFPGIDISHARSWINQDSTDIPWRVVHETYSEIGEDEIEESVRENLPPPEFAADHDGDVNVGMMDADMDDDEEGETTLAIRTLPRSS